MNSSHQATRESLRAWVLIVAWLIQDVRQARCDVRLPPLSVNTGGPVPELSVLGPARNEAARSSDLPARSNRGGSTVLHRLSARGGK